jgi:DNA replication protein DnaC
MPKTLATATVDRLLHHAHVVVTNGDSYRFTEATAAVSSPSPEPGVPHW